MAMISTTCTCGLTIIENRRSESDAFRILEDMYYTKRVTFLETAPSYSHGGLPEESILECNTCFSEWGDGHENDCISRETIEAIELFIERAY